MMLTPLFLTAGLCLAVSCAVYFLREALRDRADATRPGHG
jgi:hypothetical protein